MPGESNSGSKDKIQDKGLPLQLPDLQKVPALIDHGKVGDVITLPHEFTSAQATRGPVQLGVDVLRRFGPQPVYGEYLLQVPAPGIEDGVSFDRAARVADRQVTRSDPEAPLVADVKLRVLRRSQLKLKRTFLR